MELMMADLTVLTKGGLMESLRATTMGLSKESKKETLRVDEKVWTMADSTVPTREKMRAPLRAPMMGWLKVAMKEQLTECSRECSKVQTKGAPKVFPMAPKMALTKVVMKGLLTAAKKEKQMVLMTADSKAPMMGQMRVLPTEISMVPKMVLSTAAK
jgi:hypothetical protein